LALPPVLEGAELDAWVGFLRAHASILRELDRELRESHGLPLASYEVLLLLADAPERRLRMSQLAERALTSRSGMTRLVERLERDGLVERVRCEEDQRGYYAVLTGAGARAFRRARPTHLDGVRRRFLERISARDRARLATIWADLLPRKRPDPRGARSAPRAPALG
jgi:DNA-binding MarR family transcriptional regulator